MATLITKRPEKLIESTAFSRWSAIHNPINFEVSRKDYNVLNTAIYVFANPTLPTVKTDANPLQLPLFVSAGDKIYLKSGVYTGIQTVVSVTGNYITIDATFSIVGGAGYVNLIEYLENFKIGLRIYDLDGGLIDGGVYTPDGTGKAIINVAGLLKKLLVTENNCSFILRNEKNTGVSGGYYVSINTTFHIGATNFITTWLKDETNYYWIASVQQVGDEFGQNMGSFAVLPIADNTAKFLTMFEQPTYWIDYAFALSFIYSEQFPATYLERHQQNKNINGANTSGEQVTTLLNSENSFVNAMMVDDIDATTTQIDVWLETGGAIPDGGGYVDDGFVVGGFVSQYSAPTSVG